MAGYGGRKGPNVSQYLTNLNAIPSEHDIASHQPENLDFNNDLAAFTNTEFFDFDQGENVYHPSIDYNHHDGLDTAEPVPALNDVTPKDLGMSHSPKGYPPTRFRQEFDEKSAVIRVDKKKKSKKDINQYLTQATDFPFQPLEPFFNPDASISVTQPALQTNFPHPPNLASPTSFNHSPAPGSKRAASAASPSSNNSHDGSSRIAAEEDKRRRNTAASARFRVKKKQREQALEKTAKELNDKTANLEQRIGQLQTENEWLKNLITEKKGKEYLAEEWKAFKRRAGSESDSEKEGRSTVQRKKGVGTT
ncbi:MAG: hypothetical protein Q9166_002137 [cf. Caloplaca sp. 2 TL-2023]